MKPNSFSSTAIRLAPLPADLEDRVRSWEAGVAVNRELLVTALETLNAEHHQEKPSHE
jgi:hypothetical protein